MKAEIAVATVSGKTYYLVVNELRKRRIPFLSLTPNDPVPAEIRVVITTDEERHLINHEKILTYQRGTEPEELVNEALQTAQGKEQFSRVVIGIDPGKVFGLAVLADGKVIETANCFSLKEILEKVKKVLKSLMNIPVATISIKIGDGVPACKERLLGALDKALPSEVILESVSEAGTDRCLNKKTHRRGLRDIVSATRIAGRNGQAYARRNVNEPNS